MQITVQMANTLTIRPCTLTDYFMFAEFSSVVIEQVSYRRHTPMS